MANTKRMEAIAAAIQTMANAGVEFGLVIYPNADHKRPLFLASDPPPMGTDRLADALATLRELDGLLVAEFPPVH